MTTKAKTETAKPEAEKPETAKPAPSEAKTETATPAVLGPRATIELLREGARVEEVAPGVYDIYPALKRAQVLVNGAAMHAPVNARLTLERCYGIVTPHSKSVRPDRIYPEIVTTIVPPGTSEITEITIRNDGPRATSVEPDRPIARLTIVPGELVGAEIVPLPVEKEKAAKAA